MRKSELIAWLFDNSQPIVRYLVPTQLAKSRSGYNMERLTEEVLATESVSYWLDCLREREGVGGIHGSKDTCFENALGKLVAFGLRKGSPELDSAVKVVLDRLADRGEESLIDRLILPIPASFLASAGYWNTDVLTDYWKERIELLHGFTSKKDYSIYVDSSQYRGIPRSFKDKRLINPELYPDAKLRLPWIYDVQALSILRDESARPELSQKIDAIIDYVLDPRYQEFPKGYGIIMPEPRHYYALGWGVWLPGFHGIKMDRFESGCFVQRLEMMSHFPNACTTDWFGNCMTHLEDFKTNKGTYLFPKDYLSEKKNSYFITGGHMGLGEDRRKKMWREVESTYWMLKLKTAVQ